MTSQQYEQISGTRPDADETHAARAFARLQERFQGTEPGVLYMMTEIADGTFVQWRSCNQCNKDVGVCKCKGGPQEAGWLAEARETRMEHSFGRRGAKPPLPTQIKQRDRVVNAVLQHLIERGFTITPPEVPVTADDIDFARETLGEDASDDEVENLAELRADRDATEVVADSVDNGLDAALERVKARAQEDSDDVGF